MNDHEQFKLTLLPLHSVTW